MSASLKLVKLGEISPNPFRDIEHYPIDRTKVELLRQSYERAGFWEGYLIVRPKKGGGYEQPFGHHRVVAAKELWGPDHLVSVVVKDDLDDGLMLAMMANENSERFAQYFYLSVMEPIEAVVKAFAEGRIALEPLDPKVRPGDRRDAPSFLLGRVRDGGHEYTAASVANYLGWVKNVDRDGPRPADKVQTALAGLELIERKVLTRAQFLNLTSTQSEALVNVTRATIKAREQDAEAEARVHEEAAARAKASGDKHKAGEHHAVAERTRKNAEEAATKAAKGVAAQVAERFASGECVKDVLGETVASGVKTSQRTLEQAQGRVSSAAYTADEVEALARKLDRVATEEERGKVAGCRSTKAKAELVSSAKRLRERLSLLLKAVA